MDGAPTLFPRLRRLFGRRPRRPTMSPNHPAVRAAAEEIARPTDDASAAP